MATEDIKKILSTKKKRLWETVNSNPPLDPTLEANHMRKVANAKTFLEELDEVFALVENRSPKVELVPKVTFDKQVEKADFATLEFDGEFCQIVAIQNYPSSKIWLVYTEPLSIL